MKLFPLPVPAMTKTSRLLSPNIFIPHDNLPLVWIWKDSLHQYWQTSGPKFGPTRYPACRSIHWAGIGLGLLSPAPNRTQIGWAEMEAKPDPGEAFEGWSSNCGWSGDLM